MFGLKGVAWRSVPIPVVMPKPGLHEIAVRRDSERAGELVVHFPREDYLVVRAG